MHLSIVDIFISYYNGYRVNSLLELKEKKTNPLPLSEFITPYNFSVRLDFTFYLVQHSLILDIFFPNHSSEDISFCMNSFSCCEIIPLKVAHFIIPQLRTLSFSQIKIYISGTAPCDLEFQMELLLFQLTDLEIFWRQYSFFSLVSSSKLNTINSLNYCISSPFPSSGLLPAVLQCVNVTVRVWSLRRTLQITYNMCSHLSFPTHPF